jgi:two-component system, sensor histidine kinase and response regulator
MEHSNILVIDDERGIREGCKRALTPLGYFVATAENGDEGLLQVKAGNFDLVLLDVMMPGTSGIDLIGLIHQVDAELVCIIITGYATVELAVRAIKQGAYDFLTKPFTTDDLQLVVDQGLERRRLSLEARRLQDIEKEAQRLEEDKKRLLELDRAKAAFMLLVTHELKAPVSAILTYLDLLLNDYVPADEVKETLERAQTRAREELDMISDLLEFGKLKEIKPLEVPEPLQVEAVMQQALQELEAQAGAKELMITVEVEAGLKPVRIAADQAKSVWTNLISNAIKYTPQGGAVQIRLGQQGELLRGEVVDNGIGIPQEAQEKLFSEFYRAHNARELSIPGTGLGLAIVRQIIERAGGEIWVDSQEGKGARFTFTLPVVASS